MTIGAFLFGIAVGVGVTWFGTHSEDRAQLFSSIRRLFKKDEPPA